MNCKPANLREKVETKTNRLRDCLPHLLGGELNLFYKYISSEPIIVSILADLQQTQAWKDFQVEKALTIPSKAADHFDSKLSNPTSPEDRPAICLRIIEVFSKLDSNRSIYGYLYSSTPQDDKRDKIVKNYVVPLTNYIVDQLDEHKYTLYILAKYVAQCEWFDREEIRAEYDKKQQGQREPILDRHLRRYLFDQGIDYPFSQPRSASGEADIVALLSTDDPLVLEVKFLDKRTYPDNARIASGIKQAIKYARDYRKSVGYLVVFNMNSYSVALDCSGTPPILSINGVTCYIIFVEVPPADIPTASKGDNKKQINTIKVDELYKEVLAENNGMDMNSES